MKTILITGAMGALGSAMVLDFLNAGNEVFAVDFQNDEAMSVWAEGFEDTSGELKLCPNVNVGDYAQVAALSDELPPMDVIVNCAGITRDAPIKRMTRDQWSQVMSVNLDSVFNVCSTFGNKTVEAGKGGRIISISSINGQRGVFSQTNYSATKAAVIAFTKSLALEFAKAGVTVNCVAPGYINSPMMNGIREDILAGIVAEVPVKRLGEPSEIARMVSFLADDASGFITGSCFDVNGGLGAK